MQLHRSVCVEHIRGPTLRLSTSKKSMKRELRAPNSRYSITTTAMYDLATATGAVHEAVRLRCRCDGIAGGSSTTCPAAYPWGRKATPTAPLKLYAGTPY
jgi:hypothetical protein